MTYLSHHSMKIAAALASKDEDEDEEDDDEPILPALPNGRSA